MSQTQTKISQVSPACATLADHMQIFDIDETTITALTRQGVTTFADLIEYDSEKLQEYDDAGKLMSLKDHVKSDGTHTYLMPMSTRREDITDDRYGCVRTTIESLGMHAGTYKLLESRGNTAWLIPSKSSVPLQFRRYMGLPAAAESHFRFDILEPSELVKHNHRSIGFLEGLDLASIVLVDPFQLLRNMEQNPYPPDREENISYFKLSMLNLRGIATLLDCDLYCLDPHDLLKENGISPNDYQELGWFTPFKIPDEQTGMTFLHELDSLITYGVHVLDIVQLKQMVVKMWSDRGTTIPNPEMRPVEMEELATSVLTNNHINMLSTIKKERLPGVSKSSQFLSFVAELKKQVDITTLEVRSSEIRVEYYLQDRGTYATNMEEVKYSYIYQLDTDNRYVVRSVLTLGQSHPRILPASDLTADIIDAYCSEVLIDITAIPTYQPIAVDLQDNKDLDLEPLFECTRLQVLSIKQLRQPLQLHRLPELGKIYLTFHPSMQEEDIAAIIEHCRDNQIDLRINCMPHLVGACTVKVPVEQEGPIVETYPYWMPYQQERKSIRSQMAEQGPGFLGHDHPFSKTLGSVFRSHSFGIKMDTQEVFVVARLDPTSCTSCQAVHIEYYPGLELLRIVARHIDPDCINLDNLQFNNLILVIDNINEIDLEVLVPQDIYSLAIHYLDHLPASITGMQSLRALYLYELAGTVDLAPITALPHLDTLAIEPDGRHLAKVVAHCLEQEIYYHIGSFSDGLFPPTITYTSLLDSLNFRVAKSYSKDE